MARTGCRYHVCHVSTAESVRLIRAAQRAGLPVSCETAPHYLLRIDAELREEGRFKMNPPLRSPADREALLEGIADGTIEVVATDHAPHTAAEKDHGLAGSAMGVVGLECAFAVLYTCLLYTSPLPAGCPCFSAVGGCCCLVSSGRLAPFPIGFFRLRARAEPPALAACFACPALSRAGRVAGRG